MNKRPDDNARAQAGEVWGAFDDLEPAEAPPASGAAPRLVSAGEASAAIRAALRSPAAVVALRSTTGAGKSAEQQGHLAERQASEGRAAVIVPTHRLGEQVQRGLDRLGVSSTRPEGVSRVRLPVLGGGEEPACLHHEAADLLARAGGSARRELCPECPARKNHPKTGGDCPAYTAGSARAAVTVLQQPLLGSVLASAAAALEAGETSGTSGDGGEGENGGPVRLVVADESPPVVLHSPLGGARRQYDRAHLAGELVPVVRERLESVLFAVLEAIEGGAADGASLQELLRGAGWGPEEAAHAIEDARLLDERGLWRSDLPQRLARRTLAPATRAAASVRLTIVARFSELLGALIDAAHAPDAPLLWFGEDGDARLATVARWVRVLPRYIAAGGAFRLLDATAPLDALRAVWKGGVEAHTVDVQDAPGVERRFVVWQHAARRRHTAGTVPIDAELRGPLRRIAELASERGAREVGIIAHKPVADALRAWLGAPAGFPAPAWCPDELAALVAGGVGLVVGHYGAQRGLNCWADCGLLATLGDPWPNLGSAQAEALALGVDPEAWALELARAELVQAWGRARTVHRTSPVLVLHFGSEKLAPDPSWAPQWAGVKPERTRRGPPRTVLPLSDPSTWASERARLGLSARQHAAALGLSWTTYRRREQEASASEPTEPLEKPCETVGHISEQGISSHVSGDPQGRPSSIPKCGPPDHGGFLPSAPPLGGRPVDGPLGPSLASGSSWRGERWEAPGFGSGRSERPSGASPWAA